MAARTFAAASLGLTLLLLAAPARAVEPDPDQPNLCPAPGGQSSPCANEGGCELNLYATACIEHVRDDPASRRCEIPCETGEGLGLAADPATCAAGETCVEGKATPGRRAYYCKASSFRVDLNVVDQCIVHFIEGLQPAFSDNACSLEANLSRLLDQTGDAVYDVFDLDLCILAFLEQPGCDPATGECAAEGLVPCLLDEDCGAGLYCSPERFTCQRDCGIVASREETFGALDRECMGRLKVCDYSRGRCERIDPTGLACAVDRDCPQGAYCLVGRCAPTCNRSIDCPGAEWYCAPNNRCRALPPVGAGEGQAIDPKSFAIRFARDELSLDAVQTSDSTGIVIMDLLTKRQVIDNPAASFGYRLEVKYSLKQDAQCSSVVALDCDDPTVRWAEIPWADGPAACRVRQADCVIDDTEEWIRLASPFGVVSASGAQRLQIHLEQAVADRLSAGRYGATVRAIYDNGDSDTIQVRLTKASPSGEYAGGVTVWRGAPSNSLTGDRPMAFSMRLELRDQVVVWNELMAANNLTAAAGAGEPASPLEDVTTGRLVRARIHGNGTLAYTRGNATKLAENEVPLVGIYVPDQSVIRLVGVIDIPGSFCFGENGSCATYDPDEVGVADPFMVLNLFGRPIRRQIQLQGPFDDAAARFHGVYRETISGLVPGGDLTLDGSFVLEQVMADGSVQTAADGPILKADATPVRFPVTRTVRDDVDAVADDQCRAAGVPGGDAQWVFQDRRHFRSYLGHATRPGIGPDGTVYARTTLFPDLVDFADHIADALAALSPETIAGRQQILNVFDFVADRLLPCDPTDPAPPAACIDEEAVRCGLALHQKAILRGWVNMDALRRA
ncbi:MAG: hypothetical protein FJ125_02710, partial [Deltaproteobacteria bacterium]|nr:hypothetical protein [Deltaproteobacteria bacterium]